MLSSRKYYFDFRGGKQETYRKNECRVRATYVYIYVRVQRKGARGRPTSRAYGDADPGLVCPTATVAAVMVREAHCCCRYRTSVQVKLSWYGGACYEPVTKNKLFLFDKTCENL